MIRPIKNIGRSLWNASIIMGGGWFVYTSIDAGSRAYGDGRPLLSWEDTTMMLCVFGFFVGTTCITTGIKGFHKMATKRESEATS